MSANVSLPPIPAQENLRRPASLDTGAVAQLPEAPLSSYVVSLSLAAILAHFIFNSRYGYFRDELYYAACGQHLAWGYVDHAPLVALISRVSRVLLGDSLFALRFFPAVAAGAKVFLAGWMARETGGGRFAQALAAIAVFLAPIFLTFDNFLSMNSFEPVFWMLCAAILLRILNGGSERLWIVFGVTAGIGLLNKHSMLFFGSGILLGVLLTPARRMFVRPWIWIGGAIALVIFMPNILWEARRDWPTIQLLQTVAAIKNVPISAWDFLWQQTLLTNPVAAPIWLGGLWYLLRNRAGTKYAALGIAYLTVLAELLLLHGKIYYLAPAYPMLLAAGSVWIEGSIIPRAGAWLKSAIVAPLVVSGILAAPLAMPILPVKRAIAYTRFWDVKKIRVEEQKLGDLPQLFADMFGWEEQVAAIAQVYRALPGGQQANCALLAYNYGEAGAIDYFGSRYGLPKAISGHNQYALWGPREYSGETVIAIGFREQELRRYFAEVKSAATVTSEYAMPEESHLTIFLCGKPRVPLKQAWPQLKYLG